MDTQLNKQLVIGFLDSVERDTTKIIEYMEKTDYFKAPASTMFHLNENGGLVQHSLNVLNLFQETSF